MSPVSPTETELKLAVARGDLALLKRRLGLLGKSRATPVDSVYYDTNESLLARNGMGLRLRQIGRRWVQTLKTGDARGAFSTRGEWEVAAPDRKLDAARLKATPLDALLAANGTPLLQPRFRTRFARTTWQHERDGATIEVALDDGEVVAGGGSRREPILEIELELKAGEAGALFALALELAGGGRRRPLALVPLAESKAARGERLAAERGLAPVKANAAGFAACLEPRLHAGDALRAVIAHGTDVVLVNARLAAAGDEPEFVHQARVALRRIRSAIRLLDRDGDFEAKLESELRWIARELGAARDADVLALQTLPALLQKLAPPFESRTQDVDRLLARAGKRRERARGRVLDSLAGARFASLALRLLRWSASSATDKGSRLTDLAPRALDKAARRVFDEARFFAALPRPRQHRVRILGKRLRYALDLLAVTLPAKTATAYSERLSELQDALGELNDAAVASAALARLTRSPALLAAASELLSRRENEQIVAVEAQLRLLADMQAPWK